MSEDEEEQVILRGNQEEIDEVFKNEPKSIAGTLRYQAALYRIMGKIKIREEENEN